MSISIHTCIFKLKNELKKLKTNKNFLFEWNNIHESDVFKLAKKQEALLLKYISFLFAFKGNENEDTFDNELDLKFGDFRDSRCFYDLKVGQGKYLGAISKRSLENFGNTENNNHFYICINADFSKIVIINANKLLKIVKDSDYRIDNVTGEKYLGEIDFRKCLRI